MNDWDDLKDFCRMLPAMIMFLVIGTLAVIIACLLVVITCEVIYKILEQLKLIDI